MLKTVSFINFPLADRYFYCSGVLLIDSNLSDAEKMALIEKYLHWEQNERQKAAR